MSRVISEDEIGELTLPKRKALEVPERKGNQDYVDNQRLLDDLVGWRNARGLADFEVEGVESIQKIPEPKMPDYVARAIMQIANNVASRHQFRNYTYKEEMVGEAILTCVRYIKNFDPDAKTRSGKPNPFGYITQMVKYAFWNYIKSEHQHELRRLSLMEQMGGFAADGDYDLEQITSPSTGDGAQIKQDHQDRLEHLRNRFIKPKQPRKKKQHSLKNSPLATLFGDSNETESTELSGVQETSTGDGDDIVQNKIW